jgi:hypothetical protein
VKVSVGNGIGVLVDGIGEGCGRNGTEETLQASRKTVTVERMIIFFMGGLIPILHANTAT